MAEDRTEDPTAKRLLDARKKGQVARSRDLALAAAAVAATVALARFGARIVTGLTARLEADLGHLGDAPLRPLAAGDIVTEVVAAVGLLAWLVFPIGAATMGAGVLMHGVQGGWVFAPEALHLKWSKLNPTSGVKRFGLGQGGVEALKAIVSVAVITWLAWYVVAALIDDSISLAWLTPVHAAAVAWGHGETLLWRVAWALGLVALGDYALQKYRLTSSLKMTKQEVKDEHKMMEGSPENKRRIRRAQMQVSRRRMIQDVARATVVVTNPTHYAVALAYRRDTMAAPIVLAKGADHLALRIREAARGHGVPIVESKALAQTLYRTAEIGQTIPAPLFGAVAEILAYLVRIKQLML